MSVCFDPEQQNDPLKSKVIKRRKYVTIWKVAFDTDFVWVHTVKGSESMLAGDDCRATVTWHYSAWFAHSYNPVGEADFFQDSFSIFSSDRSSYNDDGLQYIYPGNLFRFWAFKPFYNVTRVTLSQINSINAIDVTRECWMSIGPLHYG